MNADQVWMTTFTGHRFYLTDPHADEIFIEDIAHALSQICRFTGHTSAFYSVAQHSVLVSQRCKEPLQGLLHDAAETYIGDMARPLKQLLPQYKAIERLVEAAVAERFHLPDQLCPSVKEADTMVCFHEFRTFMDVAVLSADHHWLGLEFEEITPMTPIEARDAFLAEYVRIRKETP